VDCFRAKRRENRAKQVKDGRMARPIAATTNEIEVLCAISLLSHDNNRAPTVHELAQRCCLSATKVRAACASLVVKGKIKEGAVVE
jgi:hypothetical protein